MGDIKIIDNDIVIDRDICMVNGNEDIIQNAIINIKTVYGEIELDPNRGNMALGNRMKLSQSGMDAISTYSKNAILYDDRVTEVVDILSTRIVGGCTIDFSIKITDGSVLSGSVTVGIGG